MSKSPNKRRRRAALSPKIDPSRTRWVRTDNHEWVQYAVPEGAREGGEGALEGWGKTHILSIFARRGSSGQTFSIDLSELTVLELDALEEFIGKVFSDARDVSAHRDALAQEALENGDDTIYRLYRTVPRVFDRSGSSPQHGEGEGDGPPDVAVSLGDDPDDAVRGSSDGVPQPSASGEVSPDGSALPGDVPHLREVGGPGSPPTGLPATEAGEAAAPPAPRGDRGRDNDAQPGT